MNEYPHFCRDDHDEVGFSGDAEVCPVCRMRNERENARVTLVYLADQVEGAGIGPLPGGVARAIAEAREAVGDTQWWEV